MGDGAHLEVADWKKKESLGSVLLQIAVVAALLTGAVYFAWQRGVDREQSTVAIEQARAKIRLDTAADLRAAISAVGPALDSTVRGPDAHAIAARVHAELAVVHGQRDSLELARTHLAAAKTSEVEEVVAAEALLLMGDGKPEAAVAKLQPLTEKGMRRLELEYLLARAHLAAGHEQRALAVLDRAAEVSARDPRVHTLRGDLLLESGESEAAVASYRRALAANAQHPAARLGVALGLARKSLDSSGVDAAMTALRAEGVLSPELERRAAELRPAAVIATDSAP